MSCWRWPARSPPTRTGASSTCCSPPASASPWRCSAWPCTPAAWTRSASPDRRAASSPTGHTSARIVEVRPVRILEALERGKVVIVAGYQGVSREKEVTTLGRGGSDTTAVALAAALEAEVCEICSDVDGVYTADPRI